MADRAVSYVCPLCSRLFKSSHLCQRHLTRTHVGLPRAYPTIVLLHGLQGPEDGLIEYASGAVVPNGDVAGGGSSVAAAAPEAAAEAGSGVVYVGGAPTLVGTSTVCPATEAVTTGAASICARVRALYESFGDLGRARPMHMRSGLRPTRFDSPFLRTTLRHAVLANWTGSSRSSSQSLWRLMSATPDGGPAPERSCAAAITAAFKSASGFSIAIKQEQERLVYLAGWMETSLKSSSGTYAYMYRSGLKLLLEALRDAPVKHLFTPATVGVPTELVGPSRGGIFEMYEADVRKTHGERAFVLPFSLFSDGTTLPNSKAASAHPLRISAEFLPADQPREWHSLGAFPHVLALLGRGGSERAREARRELLQRALFITLDDIFKASHDGVLVDLGGDLGVWRAFPRQVCYSADYPEKRALLCLRGIGCMHQCSTCVAALPVFCDREAVDAAPREVVVTVNDQLQSHNLDSAVVRGSKAERDRLCELHSCNALPPSLS